MGSCQSCVARSFSFNTTSEKNEDGVDSQASKIARTPVAPMELAGKVALITGAAGGLGKAFAEKLLARGAKVCLCDINESAGGSVTSEFQEKFGKERVIFARCDVTQDDCFKAAFENCKESLGKVDILVNNAGIGNEQDFKMTMDINLGGTMRGTQLALSQMRKDEGHSGGIVINIASIAGLKVVPLGPIYSGVKAGIVQYSRALGHPFHFSYTGVRVQCLCPSLVETPFLGNMMKYAFSPAVVEVVKQTAGKVPLIQVNEVADALLQLIDDGQTGKVLALEANQKPFYVDAAITDETHLLKK